MFVLDSGVRQRASKKKGIEGSFLAKKKGKKAKKMVYRNIYVSFGRQIQEEETILLVMRMMIYSSSYSLAIHSMMWTTQLPTANLQVWQERC